MPRCRRGPRPVVPGGAGHIPRVRRPVRPATGGHPVRDRRQRPVRAGRRHHPPHADPGSAAGDAGGRRGLPRQGGPRRHGRHRGRDLTPSVGSWAPVSGGADSFLTFLRTELFPWVAAREPAAMATTVYFGHSLGGLFGTHVLLAARTTFDAYVISSPSLWWNHHEPLAWEAAHAAEHRDLAARVYFGIGALETDAGRRLEATNLPEGHLFKPPVATTLDMVDDLLRFTTALRQRGYPSLDVVGVDVFADEFHVTVPGVVL